MIQVNSIEIPSDIQELCTNWAGGVDCMLRAVSSTGGLTMGTIRPKGCDTDEKWYYHIWMEFASDIGYAAHLARNDDTDDADEMGRAEEWVCDVCETLAESYGLEDWYSRDD